MRSIPVRVAAVGVVALLGLTACGRGDGGSDSPSSAAVDEVGSGAATGTISVWAMGAEGEALPGFVSEFEKANPDAKVEVTAIPWDSAHDKLQTAIAAGNGPDIAMIGTTWMADFGDAFAPVPKDLDTSDVFEGSQATATVGDRTVGVPWYVDTRVLYYRTDLAAKAGHDAAPTTWDELHSMAADLQGVDGVDYGIRLPTAQTDAFQNSLWLPWSNGGSLLNDDQSEWTIDTPQATEAYQYLVSYFTDKIADVDADTTPGGAVAEFVAGTTPMFVDGPSLVGQLNEVGGEGFAEKYATAPLPAKDSATSFSGGANLVVFDDSDNAASAWKLIRWLTQPDVQADWYEATGDLPSTQSAWEDPALADNAKLAAFGTQLKDTQAPPTLTVWPQVAAAGDTVVEQMVRGTVSVEDGLADLQSRADAIGVG